MRIQFLFAYYYKGKDRDTQKVTIDNYQQWESPTMEVMEKIKEPWRPLISRDLLVIQAFTDASSTTLAIFFTMNPKALLELNLIDPVCSSALIQRILEHKIIHFIPNIMQGIMPRDESTRDIIYDALLTPVTYDHTLPLKYPYHRATDLSPFVFQDQNIQWMIKRNKTPFKLKYRPIQNFKLILPDSNKQLFCDPDQALNSTPSFETEKEVEVLGGVLADEMGLGKTLCLLMQAVGTQPSEWKVSGGKFHSRATLVILPNHLCSQWETEIELIVKPNANTKIVKLLSKTNFKSKTMRDLLEADFVITSFQYILSKTVEDPFDNKAASPHILRAELDAYRTELYRKIRKHPELLDKKGTSLFPIEWYQVSIDEIQEVVKHKYSPPSHIHKGVVTRNANLSELLLLLQSKRKWVLSGTPIDKTARWIQNLSYVLTFITGEPDAISAVFDISTLHQVCKLFRRNIKAHTSVEVKIPPVEERIIRIPFSMQERILYSSYMADSSHGADDEHLRMLCCHPDLASETANMSSNSSSKVRKQLTRKYKADFKEAQEKVIRYKRMQATVSDRLEKLGIRVERIPDSDAESVSSSDDENSNSDDSSSDEDDSDNNDTDNSSNSDSESDSGSGSDSEEEIVIAGKASDKKDNNSDDGEERKEGDPEDDEEARLKIEMTSEQLQQNLRSIQDNLRAAKIQATGKSRSLNFMRNVTKQLGKKRPECSICLEKIKREDTGITMCGHIFCYPCLKEAYAAKKSCPVCRCDLKPEDIHHVVDSKKGKRKVQQWGSKLNYLIKLMKATSKKVIIFSQWTSLLTKVGIVLKKNGIGNIFCRGNTFQKGKALVRFRTEKKTQALMMSMDTSAAGANLTEAEYVIFLDPIADKNRKETEAQAIARLARVGQKAKRIKIWRLVIENTIEDTIVSASEGQVSAADGNNQEGERDM